MPISSLPTRGGLLPGLTPTYNPFLPSINSPQQGPGIVPFTDWPTMPVPQPQPVVNYDQARAEYGGVIPISMGTRRMPGQIVWASSVYGTFPDVYIDLGVSYGYNGDSVPADTEIARIWADGALIWRAGTKILPGSWTVTNYSGTSNQSVNSLYSNDVGAENATAFRGQLLSFFRGIPLKEFGYMIPGISAEIAGAVSETPSDTATDYLVIRFTWTGFHDVDPFDQYDILNTRVVLSSTDGSVNGTFASALSDTQGSPYVFTGGAVPGDPIAAMVQAYYIDLGALRVALPSVDTIDVELRAQWYQHQSSTHDVQWSIIGYDGAVPSEDGVDYVGNGTELNAMSGTLTIPSGQQTVVRTITLRDTVSGGSVIDAPDAITVQAFLERAAEYAGLDPDTDLTFGDGTDDTVIGGLLHEEETFGSLAQRVCRYAGWDMFEADTIKFVKPVQAGGSYSVDATIPAADLLDQGDRAITTHRRPDNESPLQMGLSYIDQTQQYKYNTQRARRILYPTRTTQSRRKDSFAVPLVITASEALSRAAQAMFRETAANVMHTFDLPPEYLYLEPGDILDITAGDTSYEVKVHKVEILANLALRVTVVNLMTDEDIELEASSGTPLDPYRGEPLPIITGTMAATDGADGFSAVTDINNANFTDGADGFAAVGGVGSATVTGSMAATDGADTFAGSGAGPAVDSHFASVVLLTGFDTYSAGSTFTEESSSAKTVTVNNIGTELAIETGSPLVGTKSLKVTAVGGEAALADHADWTPAVGGAFTVEAKVKWHNAAVNGTGLVTHWNTGSGSSWALWRNSNKLGVRYVTPTGTAVDVNESGSWTPTVGTTYTLAFDLTAAGVLRVYRDGVMVAKKSDATTGFRSGTGELHIGNIFGSSAGSLAFFDEVRITKGVARYASDSGYTVESGTFPRV